MKTYPLVAGWALLWMVWLGPTQAIAGQEKGVMQGVVFGPRTNRPIPGVKIQVLGQSNKTVTNKDGAFWIPIHAGRFVLQLTVPGYGTVRTRFIPVVRGEVTEVLLTLRGKQQSPSVSVEAIRLRRAQRKKRKRSGPLVTVTGFAIHAQKKTPVPGASLYIRGISREFKSDANGRFVMKLPPGRYDLTVLHSKFLTAHRKDIPVQVGRTLRLKISLIPSSLQLKTFTVTAPRITGSTVALMQQRKESGSVTEVLGAEEMSKTGDSSAAGALRRVSGVSLVGGRYIYVRGLGERYSGSLLNNALLPSPEPERRVVPLNLFPSGILEKIVIEKTYLPYLPGEFAGGMIQLYTRAFPAKFLASVSLSSTLLLRTTFLDGLRSTPGKLDFLGVDDGTRALPRSVQEASKISKLTEGDAFSSGGFSQKELEKFGEAMPNTWGLSKAITPPAFGLSFTLGDRYRVGSDSHIGFFLYSTYGNSWFNRQAEIAAYNVGSNDKLVAAYQYKSEQLSNNLQLGGLFVIGADIHKKHKIRSTTFLNRRTTSENLRFEGPNSDAANDIRVSRLRWIEQTLLTQQVRGIHSFQVLQGLDWEWRYTYSMARRDEPDRRTYRYDFEPGKDIWLLAVNSPNGNQRVYSFLNDNNHDFGMDLTLRFKQWSGQTASVKAGTMILLRDRSVDTRRFKFDAKTAKYRSDQYISQSPEKLFVPETISPDGYLFIESTRGTDNYKADSQIAAGYVMTDLPLGKGFRLAGGVRLEYWRQNVLTVEPFSSDNNVVPNELSTLSVLPGVGLSWTLSKSMVLRAAFARTVNRPDFRERSPAAFDDVDGGRLTKGNEKLQPADITHADLRWEWYWGQGESLSIAGFYKYFERPIETVLLVSTEQTVTYANANAAHNFGVEIDFRKRLGFLHSSLRDLYIASNITFVFSSIDLGDAAGSATNLDRSLQGQSPYIINAQLGYNNVDIGTQVAVLYNVFGARIAEVGTNGAPDVYEQPFHQLDIVLQQRIGKGFTLSFKAKNLIDQPSLFLARNKVVRSFHRGRSFSLSLGYQW